jgi:hypothetical protein
MNKPTLLALPLLCLLAACTGMFQVGVEGEPTPDHPATITALAAENSRLATREADLQASLGDRTPLSPIPPAVPPGLIYRLDRGLFLAGVFDAGPLCLSERADALPSPDGTLALYQEDDDIWVADLKTGEQRNLTDTPDRVECCFAWWPARPDTIIFNSRPLSVEPGAGMTGFLTVASVAGGDYRILDEENPTSGVPAPSPDGTAIAYGGGSTGWLYRWDEGPERFDPADYGLSGIEGLQIGSPAWSSVGGRLAWVVAGGLAPDGAYRMGIGVFHLQAGTARLLHLYEPLGSGEWPVAPTWSPDGRWLAHVARASEPEQSGLWVMRADGVEEEEHHFAGGDPTWSPDGRWLAYMDSTVRGAPALRLAEAGTWRVQEGGLSPDARLVAWLEAGP